MPYFEEGEMMDSESDNSINTRKLRNLERFFWNWKNIFKGFLLKGIT